MSETAEIDYPLLLDQALLDLVRRVLGRVAEEGLPGEHHFFLSFRTQAPGVSVPKHLATLHPDQLTIVLQHQFWDLRVDAEAISVLLRFGGAPERVTIPFAALTGFSDPSVQFALPLNAASSRAAAAPSEAAAPEVTRSAAPAETRPPARVVEFSTTDPTTPPAGAAEPTGSPAGRRLEFRRPAKPEK